MDAPLTVPAAPTQPLEAENSFSSTHCQNLPYTPPTIPVAEAEAFWTDGVDARTYAPPAPDLEGQRDRLLGQLLFAARNLANSVVAYHRASAMDVWRCRECGRTVAGRRPIIHRRNCRVGIVLEILGALTLLRPGNTTKSTGKEAAPSQVETGRAGDGIRPLVVEPEIVARVIAAERFMGEMVFAEAFLGGELEQRRGSMRGDADPYIAEPTRALAAVTAVLDVFKQGGAQ